MACTRASHARPRSSTGSTCSRTASPRASPDTILSRSRQVMDLYVGSLERLTELAAKNAANFRSEGFARFFTMLGAELTEDYFAEMLTSASGGGQRSASIACSRRLSRSHASLWSNCSCKRPRSSSRPSE